MSVYWVLVILGYPLYTVAALWKERKKITDHRSNCVCVTTSNPTGKPIDMKNDGNDKDSIAMT